MAERDQVRERERPPIADNHYERNMRERKEFIERNATASQRFANGNCRKFMSIHIGMNRVTQGQLPTEWISLFQFLVGRATIADGNILFIGCCLQRLAVFDQFRHGPSR